MEVSYDCLFPAECPAGEMYLVDTLSSPICVECPVSQYFTEPASVSCLHCPEPQITLTAGSRSPNACILPEGIYSKLAHIYSDSF